MTAPAVTLVEGFHDSLTAAAERFFEVDGEIAACLIGSEVANSQLAEEIIRLGLDVHGLTPSQLRKYAFVRTYGEDALREREDDDEREARAEFSHRQAHPFHKL